jgi:hypothetical protein
MNILSVQNVILKCHLALKETKVSWGWLQLWSMEYTRGDKEVIILDSKETIKDYYSYIRRTWKLTCRAPRPKIGQLGLQEPQIHWYVNMFDPMST